VYQAGWARWKLPRPMCTIRIGAAAAVPGSDRDSLGRSFVTAWRPFWAGGRISRAATWVEDRSDPPGERPDVLHEMLVHDLVGLLLVVVERLGDLLAERLQHGSVADVHDLAGVDRGDEIVQLIV